jgi:hypothetical protein
LLSSRVAVNTFGVRQKDERVSSQNDFILFLVSFNDVAYPLLAGTHHFLLYEADNTTLRVHAWGLSQENVIIRVLRAHLYQNWLIWVYKYPILPSIFMGRRASQMPKRALLGIAGQGID